MGAVAEREVREMYAALVFSASVHASVQVSAAPEASTPSGKEPAEQFAPFAARADAVPALPVHVPEVSRVSTEFEPPTLKTGLESASGEDAVSVVVARLVSLAG